MQTNKRHLFARLALLLVVVLFSFQIGSRADSGANVSITSLPSWGQAGIITGNVSGVQAISVQLQFFFFIPDAGWYSFCRPIPILGNGVFFQDLSSGIMIAYATRFSAYIIPAGFSVPCEPGNESLPFVVVKNAVASTTIPRLPQYKTLSFSGMDWYVKTAPLKVSPGSQFFVEENAFVDTLGRLHLRLSRCQDSWCAAEVFTKDTVGYGNYSFQIDSELDTLDPNITLGMFTWDEIAADQFHREWDIEFARWGQPNASFSAQYVVQPYTGPNNMLRFLMNSATPTTHTVNWSQSQVSFVSNSGAIGATGPLINQFTYNGGVTPVPGVGDARLHLNLYVGSGEAPLVPANTEIIISRVQYTPVDVQIGFSRTSDSASFLSSASSVPLVGGAGCSATVESDSPWLKVLGNPVGTGGAVQYVLLDNLQGPRVGNLILHSTLCNLSQNRQVLTVNQSGVICDVSFEQPSSNIGFAGTLGSVQIRANAPSCSWSVTSSVPWLRITSAASSSGTGVIQFFANANAVAEQRQGALVLNNGQQQIVTQSAAPLIVALGRSSLNFGSNGGFVTSPQSVTLTLNSSIAAWTASSNQPNISVFPSTGTGSGVLQISASAGASGVVSVTVAGAVNSPQQLQVNIVTVASGNLMGSFDTPLDNTVSVSGAIPVTGWALDKIEVTRLDILREPVVGEPLSNLIFIGTALFVADARPDVASQFPTFPYQYRAGWGYQMLTNFLPNASGSGAPGNGTYKLHAIAFNKAGAQVDLGTKTITVDNAHAAKPFGTIDTPTQGGSVSGTDYVNFGWALTPQPGMVPTDGSSIFVVIDGVGVGHPVYNNLRNDIATLFPGYKNSQGAVGFFHINTTTLSNGVHTISWNVFDDQGRGEGLGSRYFNVLNTGFTTAAVAPKDAIDGPAAREGVRVRHGLNVHRRSEPITPDPDGRYSVTMEEVGHIELHLGAATGNMLVDGEAHALPIGSTLKGGVFYWQPGPGFLGDYTMQFERPDGTRIPVRVNIVPKRYSIEQ
jgi:hypothetical protein